MKNTVKSEKISKDKVPAKKIEKEKAKILKGGRAQHPGTGKGGDGGIGGGGDF